MPGYLDSGKGKCPYDPRQENAAALISESSLILCLPSSSEVQKKWAAMAKSGFIKIDKFLSTHHSPPLPDGNLYAGVHVDFMGTDPAIFRTLGDRPAVRTEQYDSRWLNGRK